MADVTCDVNDFYENFMAMCQATVDEAELQLTDEIYAAADDAVAELRQTTGDYSQGHEPDEWKKGGDRPDEWKKGGDRPDELYEKGWVAYKHKPRDGHVEAVVANKNAPGLTHLIEKGHELFAFGHDTGIRTKPRPHIKEAYEHSSSKHFGRY